MLNSKLVSITLLIISVFFLTGCLNKKSVGTSTEKVVQEPKVIIGDDQDVDDSNLLNIKSNKDTSVDSLEEDLNKIDTELDLDLKIDDLGE